MEEGIREPLLPASGSRPHARRLTHNKFKGAVHAASATVRMKSLVPEVSHRDTVHLSSANYFVDEDGGKVVVQILRIGSLEGSCSVEYHTEENSAKAGVRYVEISGTATFEEGEFSKDVEIIIMNSSYWECVSEFLFKLSDPVNCDTSDNLEQARVRIVDKDVFPSNYFKHFLQRSPSRSGTLSPILADEGLEQGEVEEEMLEQRLEEAGAVRLIFEFLKLVTGSVSGVASRSLLVIVFDQMQNIYLALTLYLQIYLVDVVFSGHSTSELIFDTGPAGGVVYTTFFVSGLYLAPLLLLHAWAILRAKLDIGGHVQQFIQDSVFSRYMNYSKESREEVSPVVIEDAINNQGKECAELYLQVIELIELAGKMLVLEYFIIGENITATLPAVVMPVSMIAFIVVHKDTLVECRESVVDAEQDVRKIVHDSAASYSLISNYQQRNRTCQTFCTFTRKVAATQRRVAAIEAHESFFPKWLGTACISAYLAWSASYVAIGSISLGQVLATIRVFSELSEKLTEVFELLMEIASGVGPLQKLTEIINKGSDLEQRKELSHAMQQLTHDNLRKSMMNDSPKTISSARSDLKHGSKNLSIEISGLSFFHMAEEHSILHDVSLKIDLGQLVALTGTHGSGKATLLQLLARNVLPQRGFIFVPATHRALLVEHEPVLLKDTAWNNLTFGSRYAQPARVRKILAALAMDLTLVEVNKNLESMKAHRIKGSRTIATLGSGSDESHHFDHMHHGVETIVESSLEAHWVRALPTTERAKVHLARSLILNPEVLLLDKPFIHYGQEDRKLVFRALREQVQNRGFLLPPDTLEERRPRTVIFSPASAEFVKESDLILHIQRKLNQHGELIVMPRDQADSLEHS